MAKQLKINPRIVEQMARGTIKSLVDAVVELVTNCDDSYRRLEHLGYETSGKIVIEVARKKGGIPEYLIVKDYAEGMTKEELERALEFGSETSGFESGRSVRGFFGRGLKESIVALGEGIIKSVKNGVVCTTRVWFDQKQKIPLYDDIMLSKCALVQEPNGTFVKIIIKNPKIKIPDYKKFRMQLTNHYALRRINATDKRYVILKFKDLRQKQEFECHLRFKFPEGSKKVLEEERIIPQYGDRIKIIIYESPIQLDSPKYNPFGLAGILIRTESAILDNQLFKFETEPAALYFFGEVLFPGLEERLRNGETEFIDPNRGGLEWRHDLCRTLAKTIEDVLEPLIERKKKELLQEPERAVDPKTRKMIRKICELLNHLAKDEFKDVPEVPIDPEPTITTLVIKPEKANLPLEQPRIFSIYVPFSLVKEEGDIVKVKSDNIFIKPLINEIKLEKHPKYGDLIWYRYFKVVGSAENAKGKIYAILGSVSRYAEVQVAPSKQRKKGKLKGRKGGFIRDIIEDTHPTPNQRVAYIENTGVIKIFTKFPTIEKIIGPGFEGVKTKEGRILLAELIGEAFCRLVARKGLDLGKYPQVPGSVVDSFLSALNDVQKRYLPKIYELIYNWKF